jgi:UDP-GlcNAc:undecaprenyl-phosphate GlcNAc-1-phosphate transferase
MFAGAFLLIIVGFLDDILELDYLTKLLGQVVSAFIFLAFLEHSLPFFSPAAFIVIVVFWIISLSNALNFLDNMDGLCGGISLIAVSAYGVLFLFKGMPMYAVVSFAIAGGALGFLKYNLSPASIFLGDAGSLFFGYCLACLGIVHITTGTSMSIAGALGPVIILAYPAFDLLFVTVSRLKEGRKLYIGGKDHSSHKLHMLAVTKKRTVFIILLINIFLAFLGILLYRFENSPLLTLAILIMALVLSFFGAHLYKNFLFLKEKVTLPVADFISINSAFIIYFLIKSAGGRYASGLMPVNELLIALAWINAFWIVLYAVMNLYDITFEKPFKIQLVMLLKSVILGLVIFLAANYDPRRGIDISIPFIALFLSILVCLNAFLRWIIHLIYRKRYFHTTHSLKALVVCPEGVTADNNAIKPFKEAYDIVGCAGDGDYDGLEKIGEIEELTDILRRYKVGRVIIDYGEKFYNDISEIFSSAYYMETLFLVNGKSGKNRIGFRVRATVNENIYIISHRGLFATILKRLADFMISAAILLLTAPYSAYRILKNKYRTGKITSEAQIITLGEKEGKIKLDALTGTNPGKRNWWALLSVLKGDICLYGATITTMDEYKSSLNVIPGYWRKFLVKPGLFGPGYRGKTPLERFRFDLAYMEKTSTLGDFWMIFKQMLGISPLKIEDPKNA